MRIASISLHWPRTLSSGVGRNSSVSSAPGASWGHEVQFFSHMYLPENNPPMVAGEYFIRTKELRDRLLQTEYSRSRALQK